MIIFGATPHAKMGSAKKIAKIKKDFGHFGCHHKNFADYKSKTPNAKIRIPRIYRIHTVYAMVTMRSCSFKVMHVYWHNFVPHNEEAHKLARAGAQTLVLHQLSWQGRSREEQQGGGRRTVVREHGVKRQVTVQVRGPSSEDSVQLVRERRKRKRLGPLVLPDLVCYGL